MAILKRLHRWACAGLLAAVFAGLIPAARAAAIEDDHFVVLCYHEVERDDAPMLTRTAVHASDLARQFAWLQANGYHAVSLQQVLDARNGGAPLPRHSVLLTFDDGRQDVYTRVFPLLKLFHYPAVVALVGRWLDVPDGGTVDYDGVAMPRAEFVSWNEVREMQRSGLVEIASHSYDLHRGITANPQGNTQPAATSRAYLGSAYETDTAYLARLRADILRNRDLIAQRTGVAPRAMVWPYGRSNGAGQELATDAGLLVGATLEDGINSPGTSLVRVKRYLIELSPSLQGFAEAIRHTWRPDPARSVQVDPGLWTDPEEGLSRTLDQLQHLSVNIAFVRPWVVRDGQRRALFPSTRQAVVADELNRIAWQIERRAGTPVFIDLPADWLADLDLLSDLARHVNFAGVRVPTAPGDPVARAAVAAMERWRWPLRVAYAPGGMPPAESWTHLQDGDLMVLPATAVVPLGRANQTLFEFDAAPGPADQPAAAMRRLEADGFRQFGWAGLPADQSADAVRRALSLRSQPLQP